MIKRGVISNINTDKTAAEVFLPDEENVVTAMLPFAKHVNIEVVEVGDQCVVALFDNDYISLADGVIIGISRGTSYRNGSSLLAPTIWVVDDTLTIEDGNGTFASGYEVYVDGVYVATITDKTVLLTDIVTRHAKTEPVTVRAISPIFNNSFMSAPSTWYYVNPDGTEGLEYTLSEDGTYYIVSGIGTAIDKDIIIPEKHDGMPVSEISSTAFRNQTQITSVKIPESIQLISKGAFNGCSGIESMVVPFTGISRTTIYSNFGYIFGGNKYDGSYYRDIYPVATNGNSYDRLYIPIKFKKIELTGDKIQWEAFASGSFSELVIPNNIVSIGAKAFYSASGLAISSLIIPDSVTEIGEKAFNYCSSIHCVFIPSSVVSIGNGAFSNNNTNNTLTIYCEASEAPSGWSSTWNDNNTVVWGCVDKGITDDGFVWVRTKENEVIVGDYKGNGEILSIPSQINSYPVVKISASAFRYKDGLTSVVIPSSVKTIGNGAFQYCDNLTSVIISDGVETIDSSAFSRCTMLDSVTIPKTITYIGGYVFSNAGIKTVNFNGTTAEWNKIEKLSSWDHDSPTFTVHCTNGDITVD